MPKCKCNMFDAPVNPLMAIMGPPGWHSVYACTPAEPFTTMRCTDCKELVGKNHASECDQHGIVGELKLEPVPESGIDHVFWPDSFGRDVCDRKIDQGDGHARLCGRPKKDH